MVGVAANRPTAHRPHSLASEIFLYLLGYFEQSLLLLGDPDVVDEVDLLDLVPHFLHHVVQLHHAGELADARGPSSHLLLRFAGGLHGLFLEDVGRCVVLPVLGEAEGGLADGLNQVGLAGAIALFELHLDLLLPHFLARVALLALPEDLLLQLPREVLDALKLVGDALSDLPEEGFWPLVPQH